MDKYTKTLHKLYIKGMIDEDALKIKIAEANKKKNQKTEFELEVERIIKEVVDDGYVKKTVERIFKEKNK